MGGGTAKCQYNDCEWHLNIHQDHSYVVFIIRNVILEVECIKEKGVVRSGALSFGVERVNQLPHNVLRTICLLELGEWSCPMGLLHTTFPQRSGNGAG